MSTRSLALAVLFGFLGLCAAASGGESPSPEKAAAPEFAGPGAPFSAPRLDAWTIIGPGGGGAQFYPTVSPLDPDKVLVRCDMTGAYLSEDGGRTWRMFNGRTTVSFFVFDPVDANVIYCNRLGLLRSADGGKTWELIFPDPATVKGVNIAGDHGEERIVTATASDESVGALAVDPADSKTLYIAGYSGGAAALYVSADWGKTWKKAGDLPDGGRAIYIDPKSPAQDRTLYVIGRSTVSVRQEGRWARRRGPQGVQGFSDASAGFPKSGGELVIYAITGSRRGGQAAVWKSPDGGSTWDRADADLAAKGSGMPLLFAVATCLTQPDVAYVSYNRLATKQGSFMGVAKTSDAGKTWQLVWKEGESAGANIHDAWLTGRFGPGWGDNPRYLGVAPTNPNICYGTDDGRTMRTTDGGKTWAGVYSKKAPNGNWSTTGLDVTTCYGVHFDPFESKRVFITYTDIGLFVSEDGGSTWTSATANGVPDNWTNTTYWMVFDRKVKGRCWAVFSSVHDLPRAKMWRGDDEVSDAGGVCVSDDGGRTWRVSNEGMPETDATHIILDETSPVDARVLYVAGFGTGVWKSADGGKSWALKNNGLKGTRPFAWRLAQDPKGVLYLITARKSEEGEIGDERDGRLYRSTDGAQTWTAVALPKDTNGPNGLAIDPEDPKRLYLAAWGRPAAKGAVGGGVFLSVDAGKTWKSILSKDQYIYDVTIDPKNPKTLYACGFSDSAWRSTDKGQTWTRIKGFNFKWGHRVVPDPYNPDKIFITTFGGSVWYGPAAGDPQAKEDIVTPLLKFSE